MSVATKKEAVKYLADILEESFEGTSKDALRAMAVDILKQEQWQRDVQRLVGDHLRQFSPSVANAATSAISMGIDRFIRFLNSPEHKAVMAVLDEAEKKYGSRGKARRAMRKRFGGIGWRRKIRKAVKQAR